MVTPRIRPEKLNIGHMRDPRQWMPVRLSGGPERPADVAPGESLKNMTVSSHVGGVVVVDERAVERRNVQNQDSGKQDQSEQHRRAQEKRNRLATAVCSRRIHSR